MMNEIKKSLGAASVWLFPVLLVVTLFEAEAPAQVYRIAATITITNAPTTNGQTLTVNSDTRTWTNSPSLNPAIYIQTNSTVTGSTTNLFQHLATYRFSASINTTYANTNALKIQAGVGSALSVTIGGSWASVTYSTQLVSTPLTMPVIVPLSTAAATNATNIAGQLVSDLAQYSPSPPITNAYNLGTTNLSVMPIWYSKSNSFLTFALVEAGQNVTLSNSGTSIVVSASLPSRGITNLNGLTNLSQWFTVQTNGTDFSITNTPAAGTHATNYFNFPFATNFSHGKLRSNDWTTFTLKQPGSAILTNISGTGASTNTHPLLYAGPTNNGVGAPLILNAGTGMSFSTNNGTNFTISSTVSSGGSIPDFTNGVTRWFAVNASNVLQGIGDRMTTNTASTFGTPGTGFDYLHPFIYWQSEPSTNGFAGEALYLPEANPQFTAHFSDDSGPGGNYDTWLGLTDVAFASMATKTPVGQIAAFRTWDDESTYKAYTSDGAGSTVTDTGVAPGSPAIFDVQCYITDASPRVVFYINGSPVATNTATLPSGSAMRAMLLRKNVNNGYQMDCEWLRIKTAP